MRERLSRLSKPIYYRNTQWAVTSYGIERVDGGYCFEKGRLYEDGNDPASKDDPRSWYRHITEKVWCAPVEIRRALRFAMKLWPKGSPLLKPRQRMTKAEKAEELQRAEAVEEARWKTMKSGRELLAETDPF